jgi:hypothetical protein
MPFPAPAYFALAFRKLGCFLTAVALFQVAGGHWIAAQSLAWAGMLVTYTQEHGVIEGVDRTFDGHHPCRVCKIVKEGRDQEEKQPLTSDAFKKKVEPFSLSAFPKVAAPPAVPQNFPPPPHVAALSRRDAPPKPVPLSAGLPV